MSVSTEIFYVFFQANFTNKVGSGWISVKEADARRIFQYKFWTLFWTMKLWIDIKRLTFFDNSRDLVKLSLTVMTVTEGHKVH